MVEGTEVTPGAEVVRLREELQGKDDEIKRLREMQAASVAAEVRPRSRVMLCSDGSLPTLSQPMPRVQSSAKTPFLETLNLTSMP